VVRRRGQSLPVALQRPEVREHPVRSRDRDGALHVRVRGEDRLLERLRLREEDLLHLTNGGVEALAGIHRPKPRCRGDLIVARAPGMELGRRRPRFLVQEAVDHRVDVLVRVDRGLASRKTDRDPVEPHADGVALVRGQDAGTVERHGPRLGELHVEGPEPEIDPDGAVDRIHDGGRLGVEAPPPTNGALRQLQRWPRASRPVSARPGRRSCARSRRAVDQDRGPAAPVATPCPAITLLPLVRAMRWSKLRARQSRQGRWSTCVCPEKPDNQSVALHNLPARERESIGPGSADGGDERRRHDPRAQHTVQEATLCVASGRQPARSRRASAGGRQLLNALV
jgi:hypothetical protein